MSASGATHDPGSIHMSSVMLSLLATAFVLPLARHGRSAPRPTLSRMASIPGSDWRETVSRASMNSFLNPSQQVQLRAQKWKYASADVKAPAATQPAEPPPTASDASVNATTAQAKLEVAIPADWQPGIKLAGTLGNGQRVIVTPPDGARPGTSVEFRFDVPAAKARAVEQTAAEEPAPEPAPRRVIPGSDWRETVSSSSMNEFMGPSQQVQLHAQKWKYAKHDAKKDEA